MDFYQVSAEVEYLQAIKGKQKFDGREVLKPVDISIVPCRFISQRAPDSSGISQVASFLVISKKLYCE